MFLRRKNFIGKLSIFLGLGALALGQAAFADGTHIIKHLGEITVDIYGFENRLSRNSDEVVATPIVQFNQYEQGCWQMQLSAIEDALPTSRLAKSSASTLIQIDISNDPAFIGVDTSTDQGIADAFNDGKGGILDQGGMLTFFATMLTNGHNLYIRSGFDGKQCAPYQGQELQEELDAIAR